MFAATCLETMAARTHEEALIHSLISSAKRRDRMLFDRFKAVTAQSNNNKTIDQPINYRLDAWEDDSRRRRRFVLDSCAMQDEACCKRMHNADQLQTATEEPSTHSKQS